MYIYKQHIMVMQMLVSHLSDIHAFSKHIYIKIVLPTVE